MIISLDLDKYDNNNIYFCEPLKNTIINGGSFIRLLYSTENIAFNGIHFNITFSKGKYDINNNKLKLYFNFDDYASLINQLIAIEEAILNKYNISFKNKNYKLKEQLLSGSIRIFTEDNTIPIINEYKTFILKIAGLWEDNLNYGITYKFIKINHQL